MNSRHNPHPWVTVGPKSRNEPKTKQRNTNARPIERTQTLFDTLPSEILSIVLCKCTTRSIVALASTCRQLMHVIPVVGLTSNPDPPRHPNSPFPLHPVWRCLCVRDMGACDSEGAPGPDRLCIASCNQFPNGGRGKIVDLPAPEMPPITTPLRTAVDWRECYRRTRLFSLRRDLRTGASLRIHEPLPPSHIKINSLLYPYADRAWVAWRPLPGEDPEQNRREKAARMPPPPRRARGDEDRPCEAWAKEQMPGTEHGKYVFYTMKDTHGEEVMLQAGEALGVLEILPALGCGLTINGRPAVLDFPDCAGSTGRYFANYTPRDPRAMGEYLRALGTMTETGSLDPHRSLVRQLWPFLRLFTADTRLIVRFTPGLPLCELLRFDEPGEWAPTEERLHDRMCFSTATGRVTDYLHTHGLYPYSSATGYGGPCLYETQPRSYLSLARVQHYMRIIEQGARPFMLVAVDGKSDIQFVLDGHHKLLAYLRLGLWPPAVVVHVMRSEAPRWQGGAGLTEEVKQRHYDRIAEIFFAAGEREAGDAARQVRDCFMQKLSYYSG